MRILFVLPGFHRVNRGAEVALEAVATAIAGDQNDQVTLMGSGPPRASCPYAYRQVASVRREKFERMPQPPFFRDEGMYEELTFAPGLLRAFDPKDFDVTVTCSYPYVNWVLRRGRSGPKHVFVTQNGDWPAQRLNAEYRFFGCDGLVCTNPDFYDRNQARWPSALIPNGVDVGRFSPGVGDRDEFGIPPDRPIVLMVSALIAGKRVLEAIESVSRVSDAHLVVAGDGPMRDRVDRLASELLPERFTRLTAPADRMGALFRCADLFLHTTLHESFGNVYIEALATGLPVVAHRSSSTEWILGEYADLVDTSQPDVLARAIEDGLRNPVEDVAARAASAAERFSWERIGADYRAFLGQVTSGVLAPR